MLKELLSESSSDGASSSDGPSVEAEEEGHHKHTATHNARAHVNVKCILVVQFGVTPN